MSQAPHDELRFFDLYRPSSPGRLQETIANYSNPVRVRGSLHSERGSVLSERPEALQLMIGSLCDVNIDSSRHIVTVQAGTSLGGDPFAPGAPFNPQFHEVLSLFDKMNRQGLATPITGGITHQTISGFLANAADGGSLTHSFPASVIEVTLIDASGTTHVWKRGVHEEFDAAVASLGLLGVVTEVKLQAQPRFDVIGMRSTQPELDADFALFEPIPEGKPTIVDFLRRKPYARALWWPQPGVERLELWEAMRFDPGMHSRLIEDHVLPPQRAGMPTPVLQLFARTILSALRRIGDGGYKAKVEQALSEIMKGDPRTLLQRLGELYMQLDPSGPNQLTWRELLLVGTDLVSRLASGGADTSVWHPTPGALPSFQSAYHPLDLYEQVVAALIDLFVPLSPQAAAFALDWQGFERRYSGQLFYDSWHKGLAVDNAVDDRLLPVTFTEAWIPIEFAIPALTKLREMFRTKRLEGTGTFAIELYAAKKSSAWLSPANRGDVLRIDPFFLDDGDPQARNIFFSQFWEAFEEFEPCYHWGKALPPPPDNPERLQALHARFPELARFEALRRNMDPHGRFLTEYWRQQLGIERTCP